MLASSTHAIHLTSTRILSKSLAISFVQLLFKEGEVLHDGRAVTDVTLSHAFHLCSVLFTLIIFDYIFSFDSELATEVM